MMSFKAKCAADLALEIHMYVTRVVWGGGAQLRVGAAADKMFPTNIRHFVTFSD